MQVSAHSDRNGREHNEDSYVVERIEERWLLAVADGLGGHAAGEVASRLAIVELTESLKREVSLKEAVMRANQAVHELSHHRPEYWGMGTTIVCALVDEQGRGEVANVGDSRAYLLTDHLARITRDNSLVQELVKLGEITEEEAFSHPMKNIVTRAIGLDEKVEVDIYDVDGGVLLLCSDGLTDNLRDEEIEVLLKKGEDARGLVEVAKERKVSEDNITVIVAR